MTCISSNIGTLSRKLQTILGIASDLFCLTEVRTACTAIPPASRMAASLGYEVVWGTPPAPTSLSIVAPGGVALFARKPATLRRVHPGELEVWAAQGRLLVATVVWPCKVHLTMVVMYGFPRAHTQAGANEDMISSALLWISSLRTPACLTGDLK